MNNPRAFSEDLLKKIKFYPTYTIEDYLNLFYNTCREHGVKQGVRQPDESILRNTPEWVLAESLFLQLMHNIIQEKFISENAPDDLHY